MPELKASFDDADVEGLLSAAQILIDQGLHLDAAAIILAEVQKNLGEFSPTRPTTLRSRRVARAEQARLADAWRAKQPGNYPSNVAQTRRRMPSWTARATVLIAFIGLSLRYVHMISSGSEWPRQHPEGNWLSRFYANDHFEGFPLVRYDIGVNADFGSEAPAVSMAKDHFSALWDTCLVNIKDVTLELTLISDDTSRLIVDQVPRLVVEPLPGSRRDRFTLRAGIHHIRVQFVENLGTAMVSLAGLELADNDSYRFQRPTLEGTDVSCP